MIENNNPLDSTPNEVKREDLPNNYLRFVHLICDFGVTHMIAQIILSYKSSELSENAAIEAQIILTFSVRFLYYLLLEGLTGYTLGKLLTQCKVVTKQGYLPDFFQILKRTLIRFVPLEFISILLKNHGTAWHDDWSGTYVVKIKKR